MADPLSALSSAISLVHLSHLIYDVVNDAYMSEHEKEQFNSAIAELDVQLNSLKVLVAKADAAPEDHRFDGLRAIIKSSKRFPISKTVEPDPEGKEIGVLQRLEIRMRRVSDELKSRNGVRGYSRRLLWMHEKKSFEAFLVEIRQWTDLVSSILQYDHILVDIETNDYGRETINIVKNLEIEVAKAAEDREKAAVAEERRLVEKARKATEQRRMDIVKWISPLKFRERQSTLLNLPQTELMRPQLMYTQEFHFWTKGRPWILHCEGKFIWRTKDCKPGAGKTSLCAFIGNHLETEFENKGRNIPVLYMYLNYKERDSQTLSNLWASLLKQLIQCEGTSFHSLEAQRLYQGPESESRPGWNEFYKAFCAEVVYYERVVIIVDALDEASPVDVAPRLLNKLHRLAKDGTSVLLTSQRTEDGPPPFLQIMCTHCKKLPLKALYRCKICNGGRFYICEACKVDNLYCMDNSHELSQPQEVIMSIEPSDDGMHRYVQAEFQAELELGFDDDDDYQPATFGRTPLGSLLHEKPWLKDEISTAIIAKADGMFALAQLYLSSFKMTGLTEDEIEEMLDDPPEGYTGFYDQHMERISGGSLVTSDLGMNALSWVVAARRPLRFAELQHALALVKIHNKVASKRSEMPDEATIIRAMPDKATIIRATAGLITIDPDEHGAVRLNHSTAQEYFDRNQERWFPNTAAQVTRVSLSYLGLREVSSLDDGEWEDKYFEEKERRFPFLRYAFQYWGDHAESVGGDKNTQAAVMRYVENEESIAAAIRAMWFLKSEAEVDWDLRKGANALHVCAWFGLTYAVLGLLDQGAQADARDPKDDVTPLMYACRRGKAAVVSVLLRRGARIDALSRRGSSALFEAVLAGHVEVVKVLMDEPKAGINAKHSRRSNQTALMIAAQEGKFEIVSTLLAHGGVKVNQRDANDNTALSHAILAGQMAAANLILDYTAEPLDLDVKNWKGSSALMLAASGGHIEIVEKLLYKGADSAVKDKQGGTALLRAIDGGHIETIRVMLSHAGVDVHCSDNEGRGLLHGAAVGGKLEILRLLLQRQLDVNAVDKKGRTPLHDACRQPDSQIVTCLLDAGGDRTLKDKAGREPWTVAWQNGHTRAMEVLEGHDPDEKTDQELNDDYPSAGELPLWALTNLGKMDLIQDALAFGSSELNQRNPDIDRTALHYAVDADNLELVEILLRAGASTDTKDVALRTPVHLAAMIGSDRILTLLLADIKGRNDSEAVNEPDRFGTSPLLLAHSNGHMACCLILVEAGATIPPTKASLKQSLFFLAVEFGKLEAVQRLVEMGADVQMKNVLGLTGLQLAKDRRMSAVETFLRKCRISVPAALGRAVDDGEEEREVGEVSEDKVSELPSGAPMSPGQSEQVDQPIASPVPSLEERFKALEVPTRGSNQKRSRSRADDGAQGEETHVRTPQLA